MDCEIEINELKERVAKLEHRLEDVKAEVKTLFIQRERDSAGLR
jgi:tetrahydromethanopterin S-methyltransferase subunit G